MKTDPPEFAAPALLSECGSGFHSRRSPIFSHTPCTIRDNPPRNRSGDHAPQTARPHSLCHHRSTPTRLLLEKRVDDSCVDSRAARYLHLVSRGVVMLRLTPFARANIPPIHELLRRNVEKRHRRNAPSLLHFQLV